MLIHRSADLHHKYFCEKRFRVTGFFECSNLKISSRVRTSTYLGKRHGHSLKSNIVRTHRFFFIRIAENVCANNCSRNKIRDEELIALTNASIRIFTQYERYRKKRIRSSIKFRNVVKGEGTRLRAGALLRFINATAVFGISDARIGFTHGHGKLAPFTR